MSHNVFKEKIPFTYIADGHHRAASAAKVSQQLNHENAKYFLTTIFPANELAILDYNRIAKDLNGLTSEEFIERLKSQFDIEPVSEAFKPKELHQFGMYIDNKWYKLTAKAGSFRTDPIGILDVTILQENILEKLLGVQATTRNWNTITAVARVLSAGD